MCPSAIPTRRNYAMRKYAIPCVVIGTFIMSGSAFAATNLVAIGSFEGATGAPPTGGMRCVTVSDGAKPVAIQYGQMSEYPSGAQGESVPTDNAVSLSPDAAGSNGVYFVSDEAKNLSLFQVVHLTPESYDTGFDAYDTFNGAMHPTHARLRANFDRASGEPGIWNSHSGVAKITTAGDYLVSFTFNTPDTPVDPDPTNPGGEFNAKDVVIDRAYVIGDAAGGGVTIPGTPVPEASTWVMMISGFGVVAGLMRRRAVR